MHLPSLSTQRGHYCLLDLSQSSVLAPALGLQLTEQSVRSVYEAVLAQLLTSLGTEVSGLIIEPDYGLPLVSVQTSSAKPGLVITLDRQPEQPNPTQLPTLIENWGVVAVKNNYAVASVTLYYNPTEALALQKKQLIAELYDHCQHEGIDLVLKLVLYTKADQTFSVPVFQDEQLTAVAEFRNICSMLALQYPQASLACATLTSELDIPWVVTGDGLSYDTLKEVVRDSMEGGAAGFIAGESFWAELKNVRQQDHSPDLSAIEQLAKTTTRDRVIELVRIVDEFGE